MAMGIPLITNSGVGDVEMIVNRYKGGIIVDEFTDQAFTAAAEKTASGFSYNSSNIRQGATEFYSLDKANEKYINIYKSILG